MEKKFDQTTKRAKRARKLTSALAISLGLGLCAPGAAPVFGQQAPQAKMSETARPASPAELSRAFINVAKRVKPAVVHINIVAGAKHPAIAESDGLPPSSSPSGPMETPRAKRGTGSGVIISQDGYILTNNHVAGAADEIRVKLSDGREFRARRIGVDSETDLALIRIAAQNLP
ncbi:MAG: S1C family serine protease, partial [Blastocatellia bacterium]